LTSSKYRAKASAWCGVPITVGDEVIGAVGVSGMTAQQDGLIAQAGVDALPKILGQ
jgi:uncharacterized protein GlcG (DUF336 family)